MMALQASYNQGDLRFHGNGKQCLANSAAAVLFSHQVSPQKWNTSTLNQILDAGDKLYIDLSTEATTDYLTIENIPAYIGSLSSSLHGTLKTCKTDGPFYTLEDALNTLTSEDDPCGCLFTMGSVNPSYSMAILKSNEYYVFDSHSRNDLGMVSADGLATMTSHKSPSALSLFIKHLAASLKLEGDVPFEIAKLTVNSFSDSESEFSGFDEVSDGEYTCKLFLAENVEVSPVSDMSGISDVCSLMSSLNTSTDSIIESTMTNLDNSDLYLNTIKLDMLVDDVDCSNDLGSSVESETFTHTNIIDFRNINTRPLLPDSDDECYDGDDDENNKDYVPDDDDDDDVDDDDDDDDDEIPLSRLRGRVNRVSSVGNRERTVEVESEHEEELDSGVHSVESSSGEILLDGDEIAPKRGRGRKRVRNESKWRRNLAKKRRNEGKSYVSVSGKIREARMMKQGCGDNCRYKCKQKFSHDDRLDIFHTFWQLGEVDKQRQFITKYTLKKAKKVKTSDNSRRNFSVQWMLPSQRSNDISEKVCKTFFLHTLCVTDRVVATVHNKSNNIGVCTSDLRGKHATRPNRTPECKIAFVRDHIESFKCVHSHYCRKDSEKCYLDPGLNVTKMYKNYIKKCTENHAEPVSIKVYRHIFDHDYNISFHKPLKDQCDFCFAFKNMPKDEKIKKMDEYREHLQSKDRARAERDRDKQRASLDSSGDFIACCFDLEEVLLTPNSFNSSLFFKRRLNTFNLTIYDYGTRDGFCYLWNEAIGARGGCEIASCIYDFIQRKAKEGKKNFVFYTDNCIPQNKNKYYVSMLWYCMRTFDLRSIEHKYLIKGHTQNEADSIHAGIEASVKNIPVFTTPQWAGVIRTARIDQPYDVKEMGTHDFLDFKTVSGQIKNFEVNTENEKVYWNNLRIIKLTSDEHNKFMYQTRYDGEIKKVEFFKRFRAKDIPDPKQIQLQPLHNDGIPISREKYLDLIGLCKSYLIPMVHHPFFLLLPHD